MIKKISFMFIVLVFAGCNGEPPPQVEHPPQEMAGRAPDQEKFEKVLIHNARIYTMDTGFSTADAMLFDNSGRIHNVGGEQDMLDAFPNARHIDLDGKTVIPGLIDSHAHLYGLALSLHVGG